MRSRGKSCVRCLHRARLAAQHHGADHDLISQRLKHHYFIVASLGPAGKPCRRPTAPAQGLGSSSGAEAEIS
jgi:hypothetical protein